MEEPKPAEAASASLASAAEDAVQEKAMLVMIFPPGEETEEADAVAEEARCSVEEMSLCEKIFRTIFVYASYFAVVCINKLK